MTRVLTIRIPPSSPARRLDDILNEAIPAEIARFRPEAAVSRSKVRRLIVAGAVFANGRQERRPAAVIRPGTTITVRLDEDKLLYEKTPDDIAFDMTENRILFEDDSLIVVDKPAGIPTEATMVSDRDHLHAALKRYLRQRDGTRNDPYVGVHHRLDRETSGVILFTKTREVNAAVHGLFSGHAARKEYEALATDERSFTARSHAHAIPREFAVENLLGRISPKSQAGKWGEVSSGGDVARTEFVILDAFKVGFRVAARPITGRTHQIRVHLSGFGLPILGDGLYGGRRTLDDGYDIPRVMLHAARLSFPHPVTGTETTVEAPLPPDYAECLSRLSGIIKA